MFLIFDTETTGLPKDYKALLSDFDNWPRMVQLAWQLHDSTGNLLNNGSIIIKPVDFLIPEASTKIHGITTDQAITTGADLKTTLLLFAQAVNLAEFLCGHNIRFDLNVVGSELLRMGLPNIFKGKKCIDTKNEQTTNYCAIPGGPGWTRPKWPSLINLYEKLFETKFEGAHNAAFDVEATAKVLFEIIKRKIITIPAFEINDPTLINYQAPDLSHLLIQTTNP